MKKMGECPVCFNEMDEPFTLACGHVFCTGCLSRNFRFRAGCPLCRRTITEFTHAPRCDKHVEFDTGSIRYLGFVVSTTPQATVVITRANPFLKRLRRLRAGDVIVAVNGVPAYNHSVVCDVVGACIREGVVVQLSVNSRLRGRLACCWGGKE